MRKQGRIEEAYEAIRPMYRVHKGHYTSLCMYLCARDVFNIRLAEGCIDEASKIFQALQRLVPFIDDPDGRVAKFMAEANVKLAALRSAMPCKGNISKPRGLTLGIGDSPTYSPPREEGLGVEENTKLQRLLNILKGDMSVREMMAALNFHSRDKFLKNYLSPALKAGLVEMTDPNSPKSPKQRYRKAQGDM